MQKTYLKCNLIRNNIRPFKEQCDRAINMFTKLHFGRVVSSFCTAFDKEIAVTGYELSRFQPATLSTSWQKFIKSWQLCCGIQVVFVIA